MTNDPALDIGPTWSPEGSRLVFLSGRGEPKNLPQPFAMNADGSDQRPVTHRKGWEGDPVWAPDGSSIVFVYDREDSPGDLMDICKVDLDGKGEKHILYRRDNDSHPSVSPDGKRIAFTARSDGSLEI